MPSVRPRCENSAPAEISMSTSGILVFLKLYWARMPSMITMPTMNKLAVVSICLPSGCEIVLCVYLMLIYGLRGY